MRIKGSRELSRIAKHKAVAAGIADFHRLVESGFLPSRHPGAGKDDEALIDAYEWGMAYAGTTELRINNKVEIG